VQQFIKRGQTSQHPMKEMTSLRAESFSNKADSPRTSAIMKPPLPHHSISTVGSKVKREPGASPKISHWQKEEQNEKRRQMNCRRP
jgi:hypothetical protein